MNNRVLGIILAIAGIALLIVGAFAFIELFRRSFTDVKIVQPTPVPVVKAQVVVTTHDIFKGQLLEASDVTEIEVPAEYVPRDAITSAEDVIDKFIKVDFVQGEMILEHNLADPTNVQHDLSFALSDDHVLFALTVEDTMTKYSLIQQGDIVDLIASLPLVVAQTQEDVPEGTIIVQGPNEEETGASTMLTFDASQKISITGLVMDIIVPEEVQEDNAPPPEDDVTAPPSHRDIIIKTYLLALEPQDVLVLKWLNDSGAIFDLVLRAPTSTGQFDLTPVTEKYITELYGLELLP